MIGITRIVSLVAALMVVSLTSSYFWKMWPFKEAPEDEEAISYPQFGPKHKDAIDFDIPNSDDIFLDEAFESGYIHVGEKQGEMFYWFVPSRHTPETSPLVVWLTGGPGCSSEMAVLSENGPWWIQPDATLKKNKYSWSEVANVLYIDQPLATGFSIAKDPRNYVLDEKKIASHMKQFFTRFLEKYPQFKNRPFYITGESYAGHYIPAIAHHIMRHPIDELNFQGIAIGNGWVDPAVQYPAYADFAYKNNMVSRKGYLVAKAGYALCTKLIESGKWPLAMVQCQAITGKLLGDLNPYDIRLKCDVPPLCYNQTSISTFLNQKDVQDKLGVNTKWESCDSIVHVLLVGDWIKDFISKVSDILNSGYKVLVYNGDKDFICNWVGGKDWVDKVQWSHGAEFQGTDMQQWQVDSKALGEYKSVNNFTFLRVYDAGHMVPMDQPAAALKMLSNFLSDHTKTKTYSNENEEINRDSNIEEINETEQRDKNVFETIQSNFIESDNIQMKDKHVMLIE